MIIITVSDNNTRYIHGVPRLHLLLSTGCGLGFVPIAPATAAGFVGLLVWYIAYLNISEDILFAATLSMIVLTTFVGIWTTNVMERYWGNDPRAVVIDEFVGTWIPLLIAPVYATDETRVILSPELATAANAIVGFVLFRLIDIFKPLGCRWIDNNIKGGLGCVLDDILAGVYALIILWLILCVA